jgi:deoxyribonuclease IV
MSASRAARPGRRAGAAAPTGRRAGAAAPTRFLGAHVSVAGGLPLAFERGRALGCTAMQVFVKNANQWQGRPLLDDEVARFRAARADWNGAPLVAHAAYLINLAADDPEVLARSRAGLADELERCARLGVDGLVVHPGAHRGAGEEVGLRRVAGSLDAVLGERPRGGPSGNRSGQRSGEPRVLLETTAGQGSCLGWRLEQLQAIIEHSRYPESLAVCLDTCHLHAAGYAVDTPEGVEAVLAEACSRFGAERIACVHVNDSKHPRGARRDRHANLGEGTIGKAKGGRAAFAHLLRAPQLAAVPLIVETPNDDEQGHARDLALLHRLARAR